MTFDIQRFQEIMDALHPYLRWIMLMIYGGFCLYVNRMFLKDEKLRAFILGSLTDPNTGRASGKSLSGFVFVQLVAFATLVAIVYAKDHLLPEYFLISLLTFIASLYGIKMASNSKYFSNGNGSSTTTTETSSSETITQVKGVPNNTDTTKEEKPKEEQKLNSDDIG